MSDSAKTPFSIKNSTIQFSVTILRGPDTIAMGLGRELPVQNFSAEEVLEIPLLEQKLEKLTGLRFHINQER